MLTGSLLAAASDVVLAWIMVLVILILLKKGSMSTRQSTQLESTDLHLGNTLRSHRQLGRFLGHLQQADYGYGMQACHQRLRNAGGHLRCSAGGFLLLLCESHVEVWFTNVRHREC